MDSISWGQFHSLRIAIISKHANQLSTSLARNGAAAAVLCFKTISHSLLASLNTTNARRKEQHQARQEDDNACSTECRVVRPCHVWQPACKQTAVSLVGIGLVMGTICDVQQVLKSAFSTDSDCSDSGIYSAKRRAVVYSLCSDYTTSAKEVTSMLLASFVLCACEAYARSCYRHYVRLSVRLSNAWIVTQRDNCL